MNIFCSKRYEIKKRSQNLLDLKLHFWYTCACLHSSWTGVQAQMLLLDTFYHHTGPRLSFHFWMSYYMMENIGTTCMYNARRPKNSFSLCRFAAGVQPGDPGGGGAQAARVPRLQRQTVPRAAAARPAQDSAQEAAAPAHLRPGPGEL